MALSPFDYLGSINMSKEDIMVDDIAEKEYSAFMINRGLSQFSDTALIANEMNLNAHIDHRLQYDFLLAMVRKRKRFGKWAKQEKMKDIEIIKEVYGYSDPKAFQILDLITDDQMKELKRRISKGGRTGS